MKDIKINIHTTDVKNKALRIDIFDEEFLKEKDIALQPLNLVDIDDLEAESNKKNYENNKKYKSFKNIKKSKKFNKYKIHKKINSNIIFVPSIDNYNNTKEDDNEDLLSKLVAQAFCKKKL